MDHRLRTSAINYIIYNYGVCPFVRQQFIELILLLLFFLNVYCDRFYAFNSILTVESNFQVENDYYIICIAKIARRSTVITRLVIFKLTSKFDQ